MPSNTFVAPSPRPSVPGHMTSFITQPPKTSGRQRRGAKATQSSVFLCSLSAPPIPLMTHKRCARPSGNDFSSWSAQKSLPFNQMIPHLFPLATSPPSLSQRSPQPCQPHQTSRPWAPVESTTDFLSGPFSPAWTDSLTSSMLQSHIDTILGRKPLWSLSPNPTNLTIVSLKLTAHQPP